FDWTGKVAGSVRVPVTDALQSAVSPSGQGIFFATQGEACNTGCPAYHSDVNVAFRNPGLSFGRVDDETGACLWIDDSHLLTPVAAVAITTEGVSTTGVVTHLPAVGTCAGRYPGGL